MSGYLDINLSQIDKLKHCIGYDTACDKGLVTGIKYRKYEAFRNYYTTAGDNPELDKLVDLGIMKKTDMNDGISNSKLYRVTLGGFEILSGLLNTKISEMR